MREGRYLDVTNNNLMEVFGIATNTETGQKLVVFLSLCDTDISKQGHLFASPIDNFSTLIESNNGKHRLEYIGDD